MKALSIRQPWAWLILHADKDIENRDWSARYPAYLEACCMARDGERFMIHAAKGMTRAEYEDALDAARAISRIMPFPSGMTLPAFERLPRGAIVGSAKIHRVVIAHTSPWFFGRIGLVLADVQALTTPIPCKGALGFFDVPQPAGGVG